MALTRDFNKTVVARVERDHTSLNRIVANSSLYNIVIDRRNVRVLSLFPQSTRSSSL